MTKAGLPAQRLSREELWEHNRNIANREPTFRGKTIALGKPLPPAELQAAAMAAAEAGDMKQLHRLAYPLVQVTARSLANLNSIPDEWVSTPRDPHASFEMFWAIAVVLADTWYCRPGGAWFLELPGWSFGQWVRDRAEFRLLDLVRDRAEHPAGMVGVPAAGADIVDNTPPDEDPGDLWDDEERFSSVGCPWVDTTAADGGLGGDGNEHWVAVDADAPFYVPEHRRRPDARVQLDEVRALVQSATAALPNTKQEPLRDLMLYLLATDYEFGQRGAVTPHILAEFAAMHGKTDEAAKKWLQAALEKTGFVRHLAHVANEAPAALDTPIHSNAFRWARIRHHWHQHATVAPYLAIAPASPEPVTTEEQRQAARDLRHNNMLRAAFAHASGSAGGGLARGLPRTVLRVKSPRTLHFGPVWPVLEFTREPVLPEGCGYTAEQRQAYVIWTQEHPGETMPSLLP